MKYGFVLAAFAVVYGLVASAAVDLSGVWKASGEGIAGEVRFPGTLAQAHLGKHWTETDFKNSMDLEQSEALAQEYQYEGLVVYAREIELSEADCQHDAEIFMERVMWKSEAWFDGERLGERDSLATPHVYPVPRRLLTPGRHTLRIAIDNSRRYGFSRQAHSYGPSMQAIWNGVLGRFELRRAHPLRSVRVFAPWPANGKLEFETAADVADVVLRGPEGLKVDGFVRIGGRYVVRVDGSPKPWNEFAPTRYTLLLKARDGFERVVSFGFRTVGTRGHALTLNGSDIFIRGNVDNANFAKDGLPWMTVAEWNRIFFLLKNEDGVNAIRFHSWCPPAAAFEAADEIGVFLQPEAGIWTDRWMQNADEVGNGKVVDLFVQRELKAIADAYGDSPSFISLSIGNELGNSNFETMGRWIGEMKRYDPRHLYYCCSARTVAKEDDFALSHQIHDVGLARERLFPKTDWDYEDVYSKSTVPTIAHEIGQWPVYPIWQELLPKFTGMMRPWNISRHYDTAVRRNALRFTNEYHAASARLNRIIYKEEVESFLRTPSCAGLQLLNIQDYTGQAEALIGWRDPFYDLKSGFRDLPPFRTVWGPVSPLARFAKFSWTVGETFRATLEVRNLTDAPLLVGTKMPYSIAGQSSILKIPSDIAPGHVGFVGEVSLPLTAEMTKAKQSLTLGRNSWSFWVFPAEGKCAWPSGVIATADAGAAKLAVREGKTVLYTGFTRRSAKGTFKPVYWSARWFPVDNTVRAALGTWFDVKHPVFGGFVTEDFTDWQWYPLAEGGIVHALEGFSAGYRPFALSVNDFHYSEFAAPMYEVLCGRGRLFVCGYDLERDDPAVRRLRACLAAYLAGPAAEGTPRVDDTWLERTFELHPQEDLSGLIYDVTTNWTGSAFSATLTGFAPVTGKVCVDLHQPVGGMMVARGFLEGRVFDVPTLTRKGQTTVVSLPIIREDMLDGRLELSINLMFGKGMSVDRIRIIDGQKTEQQTSD